VTRVTFCSGVAWAVATFIAVVCAAVAAPKRVVSMNVCTDHLALLLAAPGQLVSVTWLAQDPWLNPAATQTKSLHINRGTAEEVLPLQADLVLAGTTTTRQTVFLMRRLGVNVVEVPPVRSLVDVRHNIRAVAEALGRPADGEALVARFEADLSASAGASVQRLRSAALYGSGGHVAGQKTLAGDVAEHVGFRNLADVVGASGGSLSVEELLFARPDLVVLSPPQRDRPSLAAMTLDHPALRLNGTLRRVEIPPAWWTCETPDAAKAATQLAAARDR